MKKILLASAVACVLFLTSMITINSRGPVSKATENGQGSNIAIAGNVLTIDYWVDSLYNSMQLDGKGLSRSVFFAACKGYQFMLSQQSLIKDGILTICDFSQRSNQKRLYVLDLNEGKVLFNTYVSHGRNSGNDYASRFSNSNESHKTCLGFMRTAETYVGGNGYSMRLDGMENGFNSNARQRAIVMHGSNYVNAQRASNGTMMGRSYGCPAVPAAEARSIINTIKGGSCFFNYYPDKLYTQRSKILNSDFIWPISETLQLAAATIPDSLSQLLTGENPVN